MNDHQCDTRSCDLHPHCPFCGGVQVEEPNRVYCVNCGTEAPIGVPESAQVAS